jgi:hypothetical protein
VVLSIGLQNCVSANFESGWTCKLGARSLRQNEMEILKL